jgi:hypothetical protein
MRLPSPVLVGALSAFSRLPELAPRSLVGWIEQGIGAALSQVTPSERGSVWVVSTERAKDARHTAPVELAAIRAVFRPWCAFTPVTGEVRRIEVVLSG